MSAEEGFKRRHFVEFWKAFKPVSWLYKNENHGKGRFLGFIIQDIEQTELGATICLPEGADGYKRYDIQKLVGILACEVKHQHDQLAAVSEEVSLLRKQVSELLAGKN